MASGVTPVRSRATIAVSASPGHTVRKTIDCLIATFSLSAGHELLHRDRDYDVFERFLKLYVVHPN